MNTKIVIITLVTLALVSSTSRLFSQGAAADSDAIKTKLKQMEDAWVKAEIDKDHGASVLSGMVAEDFSGFGEKGEIVNKAKLLDNYKTNTDTLASVTNGEMDVKVYDKDLAAVTGTSHEMGKDKDGQAFHRSYIWVDTWMLRNGKWECIAEGVMKLPDKK